MHRYTLRFSGQWSGQKRFCPQRYHRPSARGLSVIGSPLHTYGKALFKKFLFQTHPDFFASQEAQQSINSANLRYLQSIIDEPRSDQSINIRKSTRTLTFYLKADESLNESRKVRVSLHRLLPSMSEILETVGATLPPKPPGYTEDSAQRYYNSDDGVGNRGVQSNVYGTRYEQYEKTWLSTEARQAIDFLESLQDRRELLKIKHELFMNYKAIEAEVVQHTGLSGVEYRNSWSMQNNALLLQQLLRQLRAQPHRFALPWTGMKLIFAIDHGYVGNDGRATVVIDYLEGTLLIDCLEVSVTWIDKLSQVKQDEIQRAIPLRQEIDLMRQRCASYAQYLVKRQLFMEATATAAGRQSSPPPDRSWTNDHQYRVTISRGHTCSRRQFGSALYSFLSQAAGPVDPFLDQQSDDSTSNATTSTGTNTIQFHSAPLPLSVSVEVSHGIKVLPDGTLRLDAELLNFLSTSSHQTKNHESLQSQWEQKFGASFLPQLLSTWIKTSKEQQRRREEIRTLEDHLQCALSLTGIRMGLGITQEKYIRFLRIVARYLDFKNGLVYIEGNFDSFHRHEGGHGEHQAVRYGGKQQFDRMEFEEFYYPYYQPTRPSASTPPPPPPPDAKAQKEKRDTCRIRNCGVLKHLNGFTVSVGHYSGILEDGSCVLPWDFPLQQLIEVHTYETR